MERGREWGRGTQCTGSTTDCILSRSPQLRKSLILQSAGANRADQAQFPLLAPPCPAIAVKNEAYPIALTAFASSSSSFSEAKWAWHCPSLSLSLCCCLRAVEVSPRLTGQVKNVHPSCLACIEQYAGPCVQRLRAHSYLQQGRQQQQRGPLKWL